MYYKLEIWRLKQCYTWMRKWVSFQVAMLGIEFLRFILYQTLCRNTDIITTTDLKYRKKKTNIDETSNDCEEDEENVSVQNMSLIPCDKEKQHLITSPPQLVFLMSMVEICQGCRNRYTAQDRKKPNDFVLKYLMYHDQYGTKERNHYRSPRYFHAYNLGCMRRYDKLENVQMDEIYLSNTTFCTLTPDYIKKLRTNNMWDATIRN